jgi:cytochrome c biogenesis protein CcdA
MPSPPPRLLVFIAGMATVATPCVLPIIPVVLSGSVGSRHHPSKNAIFLPYSTNIETEISRAYEYL